VEHLVINVSDQTSERIPLTAAEQAEREEQAAVTALENLGDHRDALLAASDWTQLPDVPATKQKAWATYRQKLRDLPQTKNPVDVTWPEPPK
jgi:hypothetical protein